MAYGPLGLSPAEFADLTFREFKLLVAGAQERQDRQQELMAWLISWVTGPHLKKPLTPDKILGKRMGTRRKPKKKE